MKFEFTSTVAKIVFWLILVFVLLIDTVSIASFLVSQMTVPGTTIALIAFGVTLRLTILFALIRRKGPFKFCSYIWGGVFALSGFTGLLALSMSDEVEPIQAYIDKGIFLVIGMVIITIVAKYVSISGPQEN
ncbi:hypothetical protein ACEQ7L_000183 [Vibrio fluvialis]|jgi:ABC-type multidrug transport system fused ATPase/permease subunit|uniref:hypothetical protein n=1 Tax=Vibrio fluvialis TaxID=676 RepID=UPI001EEA0514|nr:hypothetical protein [Vibrio fluvialis]EKO3380790.1 hypothetical protein [Vibrio fluvialis]MCG6371136.1 hypothetical protein [Vibrio fluvialis]